MKPGRVIGGDEHEARVEAEKILDDARAKAGRLEQDATRLATEIVGAARREADRAGTKAEHSLAYDQTTSNPIVDMPAGTVDEVVGLVVRATLPGVALGEIVKIDRRGRGELLPAEVVGFRGEQAVLLPLGELGGVAPASSVWRTGGPMTITCGDELLGRVLDGLGHPIDDGPPLKGETWAVERPAPSALSRPPITTPQPTGVRAIDSMLTLGRGQRIGLFSAAGVGKSTLLGQIARTQTADVIVLCVVGERGREVAELLSDELASARQRTVVVCATSDAPALVRLRAVHVATAIAEWFRDRRGANVLLLCDSLTRVARAQREVGLSAGEPPARHGFPPSVFALLPRLIERAGATKNGVITAVYTVLVAGNDLDEPIADEVRSLVDGHIVLDRRFAQRGQFPPIDVVASTSRLMHRVVDAAHADAAAVLRARLATYEDNRDLITLGAYQKGRDPVIDDAIAAYPAIEKLLRQKRTEATEWDETVALLMAVAR
ncbi:MAG TPA: FliI/YscN family ATPase [Kofleriaceae bacterium]